MKSARFNHRSVFSSTAEELYSYHTKPGVLQRLLPPWEKTELVSEQDGLAPGTKVDLKMSLGIFGFNYRALHTKNKPNIMFQDVQEKGPFRLWEHTHTFSNIENGALLEDRVNYLLPAHKLLPQFVHKAVQNKLKKIFKHREEVLREDIALHQRCSKTPMRILITGASGVLGKELLPLLTTGGHKVYRLVRREPAPDSNEIYWNPEKSFIDKDALPQIDSVIHLAGEYIGLYRWDEEKKKRVLSSRRIGTKLLAETVSNLLQPPRTFLCASAVGYYGNTRDVLVNERDEPGKDFISTVCQAWEDATAPCRQAGIRTVYLRMGVGLSPRGGALQRILQSSKLGFIRRFGSGEQYISWITNDDMISAILHILSCDTLSGPVNIAAPEPVTNSVFMRKLSEITGSPLLFPIPARVLQLFYGQMASEILLSGSRVSTDKLTKSGFVFRHPTLDQALCYLLGK